jgi:hypothetical protein
MTSLSPGKITAKITISKNLSRLYPRGIQAQNYARKRIHVGAQTTCEALMLLSALVLRSSLESYIQTTSVSLCCTTCMHAGAPLSGS